ncbi:hypothetical protein Rhe02_05300 [Rhizocola hellebori]|uniref:Uncharacterized protein n=1 Tax=Rhizocola hellebori TaxID=1392758 RepID=A0A8J3Q260_9ACTN|nr:cellulose binding domain-containing protein [Rhizocola hellebori]GIH02463.1 hypothetical protein Rhe02_05300 [Rhizocola hellebori]
MTKLATPLRGLVVVLASTVIVLSASSSYAATPLPAPSNLQAMHVSDTSADFVWLHDGATAQDVVERRVNGVWREFGRTNAGFLAMSALSPATSYTFRVYSIPVSGLGFSTSPRSAPLSFTTLSGPDTVPPAKPASPTFSSITTTSVNVFWPETTDNVQVTGYYLQRLTAGVWSTLRTVGPGERFQTVNGLSAGTSYTFGVIAFDARGNASPRSDAGTVTTLANTATLTCRVHLIVYNPGFTADITLINSTTAPISGWTIQFTAPLTTSVGSAFNGTITRNGEAFTLTPAFYYATLPPGLQATLGFSGTSTSPVFAGPTGFTAAGVPCTVG